MASYGDWAMWRRVRTAAGRTFRSLEVRNYRLFFLGQVVSLTGTWMQSVAQAWLVLRLTGSGVALGTTAALQFLPVMLAGPWGGVVADRVDKRRLIMGTQAAAAGLALTLGVLTGTGVVRLWMVYGLAFGLGLINVLDMPARQSFVHEMVGRGNLLNAISLNGVIVNGSRVLGPALAGLLISTVGIAVCFLVNAASYVGVIAGLLRMDPERLERGVRVPRRHGQLREGLRYAWANPELRMPLLLMAVVGTLAFNFSVVFPLLVRFTFGREAQAYGTLFSLMGVGAVVGGLAVAWVGRVTARSVAAFAAILGLLLFGVAAAPSMGILMLAVVPMGAATTAFTASSNSMLQLWSAPEMRGRVMALFTVVFLGTTPIGGLLVGWVAERFGPRAGLGLGAVATLAAGLVGLAVLRGRAGREVRLPATTEETLRGAQLGGTGEVKIGSDVGASVPGDRSIVTARRSTSSASMAGARTEPSRGTNVPPGCIVEEPGSRNQSS
jgi:MFS family permease